jgi:glutamine amidotransferase
MENAKLIDVIKDSDVFKFGICLGMQLLYERSEEGGLTGLGLLKGEIVRLRGVPRVPHMGWNMVESEDVELFDGIEKEYFYFAHSYYKPYEGAPWEVAHTSYGNVTITAAVCRGKVCGTQFHPEKSHRPGATVLRNLFNMLKR